MIEHDYRTLHREIDPPFDEIPDGLFEGEFPRELEITSRIWFGCGYGPGVSAYLNFMLLGDMIRMHDRAAPGRFRTFRTMADTFYRTDLFIRDVTDSGQRPTGGISSPEVRKLLAKIMKRHQVHSIPDWMMTYFGFSLIVNVEDQTGNLSDEERRLHLAYMTKALRIMGVAFTENRKLLEEFSRRVEETHGSTSENLEKHARNILLLGEMVGVSSRFEDMAPKLPESTRLVFRGIYGYVRPGAARRALARGAGRLLIRKAVGKPRRAVVWSEAQG